MGNRRKHYNSRSVYRIVLLRTDVVDPGGQLLLEDLGLVLIGFIVSKKRKYNIGIKFVQMGIAVPKAFVGSGPVMYLVSGVPEISENQLSIGMAGLKISFKPAVMLHSFGK